MKMFSSFNKTIAQAMVWWGIACMPLEASATIVEGNFSGYVLYDFVDYGGVFGPIGQRFPGSLASPRTISGTFTYDTTDPFIEDRSFRNSGGNIGRYFFQAGTSFHATISVGGATVALSTGTAHVGAHDNYYDQLGISAGSIYCPLCAIEYWNLSLDIQGSPLLLSSAALPTDFSWTSTNGLPSSSSGYFTVRKKGGLEDTGEIFFLQTLSLHSVPEPSTLWLTVFGFLLLAAQSKLTKLNCGTNT